MTSAQDASSWTPPTQELHIKESSGHSSSSPRRKQAPDASAIPVPFEYEPSHDGTDTNLLILLHGLGDTHKPFAKLGKSLKLPQTAILALRAPQQIPFLDAGYYQWYPSFDELGMPLAHPNPAPATSLLLTTITHLTTDIHWPQTHIHLFGFAQGGSVALETAMSYWKSRPRDLRRELELDAESNANGDGDGGKKKTAESGILGSVTTIGGPLLLHHAITTPCPTPIHLQHRGSPQNPLHLTSSHLSTLKKLFSDVRTGVLPGEGENMPASQEEWTPIMTFWSERLAVGRGEGMYEVISGKP